MNFNEVIGQNYVKQCLINSIDTNKIAHAYLFEGTSGLGKKLMADILSNALLCGNPKNGQPCGQCDNCVKNKYKSHPDKNVITGEKNIQVDSIRQLIRDINIKPYMADKKVYIINDAHKMTIQAQNCLLKVLEEPPEYGIIILATNNSNALLDTIKSRTSIIKFRPIHLEELRRFLREKDNVTEEEIQLALVFSQGSPGKALEIIHSSEYKQLRDISIEIADNLIKGELDALNLANTIIENKENIDILLNMLMYWFRDILTFKEANVFINWDKKDHIKRLSKSLKDKNIIDVIEIILDTKRKLNYNANFNLTVDTMLISCWQRLKQ